MITVYARFTLIFSFALPAYDDVLREASIALAEEIFSSARMRAPLGDARTHLPENFYLFVAR